MGPYCKFCDRRCFVHLPQDTPVEALEAYGRNTIVATCAPGQAFELERTGWNYNRIQAVATAAAPELKRLQEMFEQSS